MLRVLIKLLVILLLVYAGVYAGYGQLEKKYLVIPELLKLIEKQISHSFLLLQHIHQLQYNIRPVED